MRPLSYARAADTAAALALAEQYPASAFLAGGTTEIDLIRLGVSRPDLLIDISGLPLAGVEDLPDSGLRIGALARMTDVALAPAVAGRFPAIADALLLGASQQLRNMATMGGNLCQRVRCSYFRDNVSPCNKREPGSGCSAREGVSRGHAILGVSDHCIAVHPSDVAVALAAFDAVVVTASAAGIRRIPFDDFFLLPGETPQTEHPLAHGELILAIEVPGSAVAGQSVYLKFRDRQSFEFALVSVAAAVGVRDGAITEARLALGGVGTRPWRAWRAEELLRGAPAGRESFEAAARLELAAAVTRPDNAFKQPMARRAIVRALTRAAAAATAGGTAGSAA